MAHAAVRRGWLCVQEDRNSTGAVYPRPRARQPRRRRLSACDDWCRRRSARVLVERPCRLYYDPRVHPAVLAFDRKARCARWRVRSAAQADNVAGPYSAGPASRARLRVAAVVLTAGMTRRAKVGITSRLHIGDSSIPPTMTQASGCCTCEPMPVDIAAGTRPIHAERPVMKIWRMRACAAPIMASSLPNPSSRRRRMYETSKMPSIADTPNKEMKPTAAETLKLSPNTYTPRMPPQAANGIPANASRLSRVELNRLYSNIMMSKRLRGTMTASLFLASTRAPNSPDHSSR